MLLYHRRNVSLPGKLPHTFLLSSIRYVFAIKIWMTDSFSHIYFR